MKKFPFASIAASTMMALWGCGGPNVYRDESFGHESPYQRVFSMPAQKACEGAQFALLSQGYRLESVDPNEIKAKKDFQPDDETNITIEFNVTCKERPPGSFIFANAVQTTYELKKSSQSSSLSIPSAGSISLPWGKTAESLVKVGGETISDTEFYARFFTLVRTYLGLPQPEK